MLKDPEEMTDDELLERIAALDAERFPVAPHARRALGQDENRPVDGQSNEVGAESAQVTGSFCPSCGEGVDAGDGFCRHCGGELPETDSEG